MKNRVLLLIDKIEQGGAERQFLYLASELKLRGYDLRIIQFYEGENFYQNQLEKSQLNVETLVKGRNPLRRAFLIKNLVIGWKPQAVICYKPGTSMAGCLARSLVKFNLIVSERNTTQKLTKAERLKFLLYNWATHIVPNSYSQLEFIKTNFRSLYPKCMVITNMIDTNLFCPAKHKTNRDVTHVITSARVTPQKNVLTYLEAIAITKKQVVKVHFDWFGRIDDNGEYWHNIQNKITRLKIQDYITFHGPTNKIIEAYQNNDIFLLPSLYEGFPNVLCEAMSCGLLAIASNVSDNPVILEDKEWLVNPYNPVEMAEKIEKMINFSQEERRLIGERNRQRIIKICSPENFINKYIELL